MTWKKSRLLAVAASLAALACAAFVTAQAQELEELPVAQTYHRTGEELVQQIDETYDEIRQATGRWSFMNRCAPMVNWTIWALDLQTEVYAGNGNQQYNQYDYVTRTDLGYDVVRYSAQDYSLAEALYAACDNGNRDVYNLIACWQSGSSYASRTWGHTVFIHGIVDGMVYFYESYGLTIGSTYYPEGSAVVCTIEEFADCYSWGYLEGIVHLDFPDLEAPVVSQASAAKVCVDSFDLSAQVSDDVGIQAVTAKVWTYGYSAQELMLELPMVVEDGVATVRICAEDFGGHQGVYYAAVYVRDFQGNETVEVLEEKIELAQLRRSASELCVCQGSPEALN